MSTGKSLLMAALIFGSHISTHGIAVAQSIVPGDEPVCAAIYPCDDQGNLLSEFSSGECGAKYAEQCEMVRLSSQGTPQSCESEKDGLEASLRKERALSRKLRRKIRALEVFEGARRK